jgi:hypothetical protein
MLYAFENQQIEHFLPNHAAGEPTDEQLMAANQIAGRQRVGETISPSFRAPPHGDQPRFEQ